MTVHVLLEHRVPDFDDWKRAFDADPIDREGSGVRAYRVLRPVGNRNHVVVDLEFDKLDQATAFRAALVRLWDSTPAQAVMANPTVRIVDVIEVREYAMKS